MSDRTHHIHGPPSSQITIQSSSKFEGDEHASPDAAFAFGIPLVTGDVGTLGGYRLVKELGRGGMGVVYLAIDIRLTREVALKVMLPQFASNADARVRFEREARAQAQVAHDHVVAIHQVADYEGLPYLEMPLLKGMTLHTALQANPTPPVPEVIRIGREVAEGLAAAHERGLVHRDIKPANVWLEDKKLRVKILDFGLAHISLELQHAAAESLDGPLTQEGTVVGTPQYMSPEQSRGFPVDGRTDLWSLGVILYQMTTGVLPFRGATTLALLESLATENPPPPITINQAVSQALSDFIMRLLAKDPEQRIPSAEVAAAELRVIESSYANAARGSFGEFVIPIVVHEPAADSLSNLVATPVVASVPAPVAPSLPRPRVVQSRDGYQMWAVAGGVLLAVAGVVLFVAMQSAKKSRDHEDMDDPSPLSVEKKEKPSPATDPDHMGAVYVISCGGSVNLDGKPLQYRLREELPPGNFRLTNANLGGLLTVRDGDLVALKDCKNLRSLDLSNTAVTDVGLLHFKDSTSLQALSLGGTRVSSVGLANFSENRNLQTLNLPGTRVTDAGLLALKGRTHLTSVSLNKTVITDAGLAALKDSVNLAALNLESTTITDVGLAQLKNCRKLSNLTLQDCPTVTDAALTHLAGMELLTSLILDGTAVTGTGFVHLGNCKNLKSISLRGAPITDESLIALKDVKSLLDINMQNTNISNAGLMHLATLKTLANLWLNGTKVTQAGVAELQKALPKCKISADPPPKK